MSSIRSISGDVYDCYSLFFLAGGESVQLPC